MRCISEKATWSFSRKANDYERFSAGALSRLLWSLPSWRSWSGLRSRQQSFAVECIRSIAEVVIWGDQHDPEVFAVFKKEGGLERLTRVLKRKSNRRGPIAAQVLQTFAMLVQNLRDKNALNYLLNHEATRTMISMDFDFSDEDVLGYYVSFVKSISFKLSESTVSSFTKRHATKSEAFSMPLFSEATKFIDSPERMVRSAARTLTLTIMSLKNDEVDRFLVSDENRGFFKDLVRNLGNKSETHLGMLSGMMHACDACLVEEVRQLKEVTEKERETVLKIDHLTAEIEDVICYLNDIYTSGSKGVQVELAHAIWDEMLGQYLILPVFDAMNKQIPGGLIARAVSEEGLPLLQLPTVETLMSIASEWTPVTQSDIHWTMVTTFVTSTMNVLLRRADFVSSRILMQLVNRGFTDLETTARQRVIPLVNVDLETLDLNEDTEWTIEATNTDVKTKLTLDPEFELLRFADCIGFQGCVDVLRDLFHQTKCQKYKPSVLLESIAKNQKSSCEGRRFIPFTHSPRNPIKSVSARKSSHSLESLHRRVSSVAQHSTVKRQRRVESF